MNKRNVAIVGIDGGTLKILRSLMKINNIPNISHMFNSGYSAILKSTIPPTTIPGWYSLATGLNPGKLGICSFMVNKLNNKRRLVSSKDIQGKALWDYISDKGLKSAIINFPTYPPYPINGYFVTGMLTPSGKNYTYPLDFKYVIEKDIGEYYIDIDHYEYGNTTKLLEVCIDSITQKSKLINLIIKKEYINFLFVIFTETDRIQHHIWNKMKIYDDRIEFSDKKLGELFFEFWIELDKIIGEILKRYQNVIIVSDHGFTSFEGEFYINEWLIREGFLKCSIKYSSRWYHHMPLLENFKKILIKYGLFDGVVSLGKKIIGKNNLKNLQNKIFPREKINLDEIIIQEESKAYALEGEPTTGQIAINSNNEDEKRKIRKLIIKKLKIDLGSFIKVYTKEELYWGPKKFLKRMPDIIFYLDDWKWNINPYIRIHTFSRNVKEHSYLSKVDDPRVSGVHDINGIFIAYGKDIKQEHSNKSFQILDIAPTVLFMLNIPLPRYIDGKVIKEIFKQESEYYIKKVEYSQYINRYYLKRDIYSLKKGDIL